MTTAVTYLRVSSAEQVKNTSLDDQAARTRKHIESKGWTLLRSFREEGKSAKDGERPELKAMLRFCQENEVDYVVALDMTRLSRNTEVFLKLRRQFSSFGTKLSFVAFDPGDSIEGEFMSTIQAAVAEFDNRQRGLKAKRGMDAMVKAGGWPTCAPRGFKCVRKGRIPSLSIDPETSFPIRKAFEDAADGRLTVAEAGRTIGISPAHVAEFFARPVFAGYNLVDGQLVKGSWEGLVTLDTWQRVQDRIKHKVHTKQTDFWLRGFVCCECGHMLTASYSKGRGGRYGYYHCKQCGARHPARRTEDSFKAWLDDLGRKNAKVLADIKRNALSEFKAMFAGAEEAKRRAGEEVDRLSRQLSALVDLHVTGGLSRAEYDAKRAELVSRRAEYQREYLSDSVTSNEFLDMLDYAGKILADFTKFLGIAGHSDLMVIVRSLVGSTVSLSRSGDWSNRENDGLYWLNSMLNDPDKKVVCLTVRQSNHTIHNIVARLRVASEILAMVLERSNSKEAQG